MVFENYSKYYDLLYKDKNYKNEVGYIDKLIKKYSNKKINSILNIGCGTGNHDVLLTEKGYKITGIDLSEDMIKIARQKETENLKFQVCDALNFNLNKKFDVILSLFHVISYQTSNIDLNNFFKNIELHLEKDGLFIFDCWYGPAVLTDRPVVRVKRLEDEEIKIIRIAEPVIYPNENIVDVNYDVLVIDKKTNKIDEIKETHKMRYLFKTEIEEYFRIYGFELLLHEEWITGKNPDFNTWGTTFIGRKN